MAKKFVLAHGYIAGNEFELKVGSLDVDDLLRMVGVVNQISGVKTAIMRTTLSGDSVIVTVYNAENLDRVKQLAYNTLNAIGSRL